MSRRFRGIKAVRALPTHSGDASNIIEYNEASKKSPELVTLLVIYDFPSGFDDKSAALLNNILRNGKKCGIYIMIAHNTDVHLPKYSSIDEVLDEIRKQCTVINGRRETC